MSFDPLRILCWLMYVDVLVIEHLIWFFPFQMEYLESFILQVD